MSQLILKRGYKSELSLKETEIAIKLIKDTFERKLAKNLNLTRVSAPLFVTTASGLNDNLNGTERVVGFDIKNIEGKDVEIVQSLAKWKRNALKTYNFSVGEGLYTDMNAIRRDDEVDNIHSIYVDQWDWEKIIDRNQRNLKLLKNTVKKIVSAIVFTANEVKKKYKNIEIELSKDVYFITSQELEDMYKDLTPKMREEMIVKKYKTVFIMQIGGLLKSGIKHDGRAPDYDDWKLNGDLMFWDEVLNIPLEISSMGIRVDEKSLETQLKITKTEDRKKLDYHKKLLNGDLPLTIGGGIGQSRLCMLILEKVHIGEVHASVWSDDMIKKCEENNIILL